MQALLTVSMAEGAHLVELRLPGIVDGVELDHINARLLTLADEHPGGAFVLDLHGTQHMGSALLGMMVNLRTRVRAGDGRLAVCGVGEALLAVFRTVRFERLFDIVATREQALRLVR